MEKYALLRGVTEYGSPLVHRVEPGTRYGLEATAGLDKTASAEHLPEVMELVESISPQQGRLYLVNSALGSGEYVGCNLRGDWFTEAGLKHTPPGWEKIPVWDIDARRRAANHTEAVPGWGNLAWGYPTFYNAHRFRHHANQNPERAYGFILGAFWDPRMHRVILVSELVKSMCETLGALHIYNRIEAGEFPDSSMGSKVPYDECTICHNLARSPSAYCRHVNDQDPEFGRKKILPDGRICGMLNHQPRFFDDSFVFIGADRTAKVMSNITQNVKGRNPYTQTIYPFSPGLKLASVGAPPTEREETVNRLARSVDGVEKAEKSKDMDPGAQLDRVLRGIPVGNPKERAALNAFGRRRSLKKNGLPDENEELTNLVEEKQLSQMGVDLDKYRHLDDAIEKQMSPKQASHAKWAEILKRIPDAGQEYKSVVRAHGAGLPTIPRDRLDAMGDLGDAMTGCAHLGVVLKPEEFQYLALRPEHPELASDLWEEHHGFPRCVPSPDMMPSMRMDTTPPPEIMAVIRSLLGNLISERSFAPAAVRIRITQAGPVRPPTFPQEVDTPLLRKVSSLYNEYRAALLESAPSWRNVSVGQSPTFSLLDEPKLASASQELSHHLLCLAYWPVAPIGW